MHVFPRLTRAAAVLVCAHAAHAQSWQSDYTWCHVGAAGNRGATPAEAPAMPGIGSVGYEFKMAQVPVTVGQYWEFVQAYLPHYQSRGANFDFTGDWIHISLGGQVFPPSAQTLNRPATPSWEYAARFVNWLHNGKGSDLASFESGVYDTSTFTRNPDGSFNHVATPAAGATVWMPTLDEYTKAFHYDPSKNGDGQDGYWLYPHTSDVPPIPGLAVNGGETDAGDPDFFFTFQDVGSYPDVFSPWGLLDASGGELEWTSTLREGGTGSIFNPDSARADTGWGFSDRLDFNESRRVDLHGSGFRLVVPVPGPSVLPAFVVIGLCSLRRKGRTHAEYTRGSDRDGGRTFM